MNRFNECIVAMQCGICQYYVEPIQKNVIDYTIVSCKMTQTNRGNIGLWENGFDW